MPLPKIRGHILCHHVLIRLQRLQIARSQLRRNLEAHMQQLPEARIVRRVLLVVPSAAAYCLPVQPFTSAAVGSLLSSMSITVAYGAVSSSLCASASE